MTDYPNRSDLRNPATRKVAFTGQTYGQGAAQAQAQAAVPPGSSPEQVAAQRAAAQQTGPRPGSLPLFGPTERPNEPITAGADFGPGPNAMQAGIVPRMLEQDDTLETLKAVFATYPNDDLAQIIMDYVYGVSNV